MRTWQIEHDNSDTSAAEWWIIENDTDNVYFHAFSKEDADYVCQLLNDRERGVFRYTQTYQIVWPKQKVEEPKEEKPKKSWWRK